MNRFVKTALAIAVAGSAAQAGTGDNEWKALDSEISGLASSLKQSQDGFGWSALVRAVYSHSRDDISTGMGSPDTSGFNLNDVDLAFWGNQGPFSWRVSADLDQNGIDFEDDPGAAGVVAVDSDTELDLEDAYVRWGCGEYFDAMMGSFKPRITRSNSVDPEKQLFIDRTSIGAAFDSFDLGVGATGSWEDMLHWSAALMNGLNGHERDHLYVVRAEFDLGTGAGEYEGAMGSSDVLNATIGLSFLSDDTLDEVSIDLDGDGANDGDADGIGDLGGFDSGDRTAWVADINGSVSNFGFGAELAWLDDDFGAITDEDYGNIYDSVGTTTSGGAPFLILAPDSMPWNVTASYLINPEVEVGVRYEDLDNSEIDNFDGPDNEVLSVVVNWYRGNSARWQAQWTKINAGDGDFNEGDVLEIGFAIGSTR